MLIRIALTTVLFLGSLVASYAVESQSEEVQFEQVTRIAHQG